MTRLAIAVTSMGNYGASGLVRTYGRRRVCAGGCGTVLSQYNPGRVCQACHVVGRRPKSENKRLVTAERTAEVAARLAEFADHYGDVRAAAAAIGIGATNARRLLSGETGRVTEHVAAKVLGHRAEGCGIGRFAVALVPLPVRVSRRLTELHKTMSYTQMAYQAGVSKSTVIAFATRRYETAQEGKLAKVTQWLEEVQ